MPRQHAARAVLGAWNADEVAHQPPRLVAPSTAVRPCAVGRVRKGAGTGPGRRRAPACTGHRARQASRPFGESSRPWVTRVRGLPPKDSLSQRESLRAGGLAGPVSCAPSRREAGPVPPWWSLGRSAKERERLYDLAGVFLELDRGESRPIHHQRSRKTGSRRASSATDVLSSRGPQQWRERRAGFLGKG